MILASMIRLGSLAMTSEIGFAPAKTSHCVAQLMCSAGSASRPETTAADLMICDQAGGQLPLIDQAFTRLLLGILAINSRKS